MEIQPDTKTDHYQLHKRKKYTHQIEYPSSSSVLEPAVQIPDIPDDLILEILSRLPVKPLLRFRCVSKSWDSLISSPLLIKTHLEKSSNNHDHTHHRLIFHTFQRCQNNRLLFNLKLCPLHPAIYHRADDSLATQAAIMDDHLLVDSLGNSHDINHEIVMEDSDDGYDHEVFILGSCNGLLCVYVFGEVFLWNPSIRKSKKLPDSSPKSGSADSVFYGFGYDESNDDYKVFRISESSEKWVDVYSRNTNSWRRIEDFKGVLIDQGVYFVNGKLHWTVGSTGGEIITLDLTDEMYGEVEQPKYGKGHVGWDLKLLGGCLAMFCYHPNGHVDLWIMQEYGVKESWTKVVLMINCAHFSYQIFRRPIFLLKDGDILFQIGDGLVLYNPKRRSFTYLHIANVKTLLEVDVYVESLVLLNDNYGVEIA